MAHSYYKLPDDDEEVIRIALALRPEQILAGEVNPVSLCRRLVVQIRALQYQGLFRILQTQPGGDTLAKLRGPNPGPSLLGAPRAALFLSAILLAQLVAVSAWAENPSLGRLTGNRVEVVAERRFVHGLKVYVNDASADAQGASGFSVPTGIKRNGRLQLYGQAKFWTARPEHGPVSSCLMFGFRLPRGHAIVDSSLAGENHFRSRFDVDPFGRPGTEVLHAAQQFYIRVGRWGARELYCRWSDPGSVLRHYRDTDPPYAAGGKICGEDQTDEASYTYGKLEPSQPRGLLGVFCREPLIAQLVMALVGGFTGFFLIVRGGITGRPGLAVLGAFCVLAVPVTGLSLTACQPITKQHACNDKYYDGDANQYVLNFGHRPFPPLANLAREEREVIYPLSALASGLLGLALRNSRDRAHGAPERVRVAIGSVFARGIQELLALGARVFVRLRRFCHGASRWLHSLTDLLAFGHREVCHG